MRSIIASCLILQLFPGLIQAQSDNTRVDSFNTPRLYQHFEAEYTYDNSVDTANWLKVKPGLHASFASTNKLYFRKEVPNLQEESVVWEETGWRGERLNTQILLWAPDSCEQVRVILHDLKDSKGNLLSQKNIKVNMIRYVLSNYPYNAVNTTCEFSPYKTAFLMPDRFEEFDRFELSPRTVRPVWLSVDVPVSTIAGVYSGTIEVRSQQGSSTLQLKVKVQNQVLPAPQDWSYRLDLWQNPWVLAWYYHLKPWSPEHKALLKQHLSLYAAAGGKYITTYTVHSPWSDNSYMIEGTMIEWTRRKDKSWHFDYNIFDQYVQLAMEVGINKAITIYTPVPWGNRFRYIDEATGEYVFETWNPGTPEYQKFWNVFLTDLRAHLQKKGWLEKTYLGINENEMSVTLAAINAIKQHSKQWKITYAGNYHKELDGLLDDYSFLYGFEPGAAEIAQRSKKGFTSTFYVCCNPAKPNNFVFSPPVEGRWLSWYTAARGYNGFLRWAYDAWPADPARDARHTLWPAGDCFLVYPGAGSNIRYEKLREGIVDFEKIRILRELTSHSQNAKAKETLDQLNQHLKIFAAEKEFEENKLNEQINKGRALIESLSDQLTK